MVKSLGLRHTEGKNDSTQPSLPHLYRLNCVTKVRKICADIFVKGHMPQQCFILKIYSLDIQALFDYLDRMFTVESD